MAVVDISASWGFLEYLKLGYTKIDGLYYTGKSQTKMDDDWGYPHDFGNLHTGLTGQEIMVSPEPVVKRIHENHGQTAIWRGILFGNLS